MFTPLKRQWQGLQHSPPGHRFQTRYANARKQPGPTWLRAVRVGGALVLVALGAVFAVIPGPAVVFFALAGALLAAESRTLARGLDWTELRLRTLWSWGTHHWQRLGVAGRIFVVTLGLAGSAGAAFIAWRIFLG